MWNLFRTYKDDLKIKGNSDKMFFNILNSIAKTIIEHENDVTDEEKQSDPQRGLAAIMAAVILLYFI